MFLKSIDLTTALRPAYLPDEVLLFVQDNVGLYEGKYKLPNQQDGQVYLTSHRVCYVDKDEPRKNSVALDLKDVDKYEFYARFLKSSPKVTLVPKPIKRSSLQSRVTAISALPSRSGTASPSRSDSPSRPPAGPPTISAATWVCTICSFPNPVPSNFDPTTANIHTPLPPCLACGIKPTLAHLLKAAISAATNRSPAPVAPTINAPLPVRPPPSSSALASGDLGKGPDSARTSDTAGPASQTDPSASFQCPRCTFLNHPSLLSCEICGAPLISQDLPSELTRGEIRTESPGPILAALPGPDTVDSVKISFRGGGEKIFYERLKGSMMQRKWLLQGAPPIPKGNRLVDDSVSAGISRPGGQERVKGVGIAALEQRGLDRRKNNEVMIGSAFEDLEALMASAKEIVALAESFARQVNGGSGSVEANAILAESATQLGLVTTKDIVGGGGSESLYLSELARNLAEYLTDDARGVLRKAGGIISLVDLWAMFNRARGGVELVSPMDFEKAARLWTALKLPVRLRTFKSGVMVVQAQDHTDQATIKAILSWLADLHEFTPDEELPWDWRAFGRGVTARDTAERFGWSIGVAEEELEMAEEHGALCREEGIEGLRFWENLINMENTPRPKSPTADEQYIKSLQDNGFL